MPKINLKKFTHGNMPQTLDTKGYLFDKNDNTTSNIAFKNKFDISKALKVYDDKTDVVISLTKSNKHPSFNMVKLKGEYAKLAVKPYRKIYNETTYINII